jgi:putative phosphoribosyl transferase
MYFASRLQAGRMLAVKLAQKYRYENCAIVALDDGGVIVGAQIAIELHCVLTLLNSKGIFLPMEPEAIAGITDSGVVAYNSAYSTGEMDEILSENRGFVEQEKLRAMHELNRLVGDTGTVDKKLLKGQNVILVSEGFKTAFEIDLAYEFLKPVAMDKIIFATPLASVPAVDRMHILGDEIYCLDVIENYHDNDHYYDNKDVPSHEKIIKVIERVVLNWR